ncbi:hypothetical protein Tco_0922596 [Tanacetum coccineum]|uniref:Uncharacterized protein n=1 Tax=Tanacetum coccineum TaxID=301880 RepID=A0ABQ5D1D4_9ASTR
MASNQAIDLQDNLQVLDELPTKTVFTKCPSVLYQNFLREFWYTAIAYDPNPSTNENKPRPLKEFLIQFTVMNGKKPLTLDFNTFTASTGFDYHNGAYVAHPSPEVVKAELAKIVMNPSYLDKTLVLKNSFLVAWRILLTFFIQVLGGNYSSTEQVNSIQQLITYSLIIGTQVDIGEIIYSDLVTKLLNKSRLRYVSYPRFISCALEALLGLEYTRDEKFRYLPGILSNFNFSKDLSKVTKIELTAHMIVSQGPKASGALSKKRKQPKPKKTPSETKVSSPKPTEGSEQSHSVSSSTVPDPQDLERNIQLASMGLHSTLDEGTRKSQPLPEGTTTDPKDSAGNDQPTHRDLTFTASDEGAAKTMSFPEGPCGDKDSEGLKPPAHMEPQTNPAADLSGTNANDDDVFEDGEDMEEDTQADEEEHQQLVKYLRKGFKVLFNRLTEEQWAQHAEATISYADLKAAIEGYYEENIDHKEQTDRVIDAAINSLNKNNIARGDILIALNGVNEALKAIQDVVKENPTLHKKGLQSSVASLQATATSQDKHLAESAKSSTSIAWNLGQSLAPSSSVPQTTLATIEGSANVGERMSHRLTLNNLLRTLRRSKLLWKKNQQMQEGKSIVIDDQPKVQRKLVTASKEVRPDLDAPVLVPYKINGKIFQLTKE